jgi:hypothetical protein
MSAAPIVSPEIRRALDLAHGAIRGLVDLGIGVRGLVGMDAHGTPVIAIDPPADCGGYVAEFACRRLGTIETAADWRSIWAASYGSAILTWAEITQKPRAAAHHGAYCSQPSRTC